MSKHGDYTEIHPPSPGVVPATNKNGPGEFMLHEIAKVYAHKQYD
jgi:hypothetical protein